jgi:hypothetical protein
MRVRTRWVNVTRARRGVATNHVAFGERTLCGIYLERAASWCEGYEDGVPECAGYSCTRAAEDVELRARARQGVRP